MAKSIFFSRIFNLLEDEHEHTLVKIYILIHLNERLKKGAY